MFPKIIKSASLPGHDCQDEASIKFAHIQVLDFMISKLHVFKRHVKAGGPGTEAELKADVDEMKLLVPW